MKTAGLSAWFFGMPQTSPNYAGPSMQVLQQPHMLLICPRSDSRVLILTGHPMSSIQNQLSCHTMKELCGVGALHVFKGPHVFFV